MRAQRTALLALGASALGFGLITSALGCSDPQRIDREYAEVREVLSLDGTWQVEQGDLSDTPPAAFTHTAPVPALLGAAEPAFDEVGVRSDLRQAFWYRTTFTGPRAQARAWLDIHKAKYGIKVWLNDLLLGEHHGCFTRRRFDVSAALRPEAENTLLVRVGAWLDSVPRGTPVGQDAEKIAFLPGIYDDVRIVSTGAVRISNTKVEPDLEASGARVLTWVENSADAAVTVELESQILTWDTQAPASGLDVAAVTLAPGETRRVAQSIAVPDARLWSTADPYLYVVRSAVRSNGRVADNTRTRFGMRTVEFRPGTDHDGRFYLNGELTFLRGSNITLHRFFEDPLASTLAWDEDWVRELLTSWPRELHWNSFRISVGRAPELWYDIADEAGLLLADEFPMWTVIDDSADDWSAELMAEEFEAWIGEAWNHPSIAWWDAANETFDERPLQAIEAVRHLDETRPWEAGGYNAPHRPADPIEDHPYVFSRVPGANDITKLDDNDGCPPRGGVIPGTPMGTFDGPEHAYINNEYGWLWIDRLGQPTEITVAVYNEVLGPGPHTPEVYREAYAYLVGGMTEFWRARRYYAGIQHFSYLGYSRPGGDTSDNFVDIEALQLEPRWVEYATNAFAPVMVYIDSWTQDRPPGQGARIPVSAINDTADAQPATLTVLAVTAEGEVASRAGSLAVDLPALGRWSGEVALDIPASTPYLIVARLAPDSPDQSTVYSRRKVGFATLGAPAPDPPYE